MQKTKIFRESQVLKSSHLNTTGFSVGFLPNRKLMQRLRSSRNRRNTPSPTLKTLDYITSLTNPYKMTEFEDVKRSCRKEF